MGRPAARIGDMVLQSSPHCHAPIHPAAPVPTPVAHPAMPLPIITGSPNVLIGGAPAARLSDQTQLCMLAACVPGGPGMIAKGSVGVFINGLPAARMGDMTFHAACVAPIPAPIGRIIPPCCPTVLIGDVSGGGGGVDADGSSNSRIPSGHRKNTESTSKKKPAAKPGSALAKAASSVNPSHSVVNCGNIIDSVISRLRGTNSNAIASPDQDGSWAAIEKRLNTRFDWDQSFQSAFDKVHAGGNGTIVVVGIRYSDGLSSHIVTLANDHGVVGIVEGQNWGNGQGSGVISSVADANKRYNPDGGSNVGVAIVP